MVKVFIVVCCCLFVTGIVLALECKNGTHLQDGSVACENQDAMPLPPLSDTYKSSLSFIKDSLCVINDAKHSMREFVSGLEELLAGKDTVINIVHLGDSHIQAGFLSGSAMRRLQQSFGNAGRGWIAPLKLSSVNEPTDYFIKSNIKDWTAGRCVQAEPKCPWGIGGIGIQTDKKDVDFSLVIAPNNGVGYHFNKVMLFRDAEAMPMTPKGTNADSVLDFSVGRESFANVMVDTFRLASLADSFSMESFVEMKDGHSVRYASNRYYGFVLENGHSGILYHSIGVNGARYKDFTDLEFMRQLSLLKPSLLIVSFGTNEAVGRNFDKNEFTRQLGNFIQVAQKELVGTPILVTTPAETFRRVRQSRRRYTYVRNENIGQVADAITKYAKREGLAVWDLYKMSGGANSCNDWFKAGMYGRDRIHFSKEGYVEQGALLYKAIVRFCLDDVKKKGQEVASVNYDAKGDVDGNQ